MKEKQIRAKRKVVVLKGQVASSKNNKQIRFNKYTRQTYLTASDYAQEYIESLYPQIVENRDKFLKLLEGKEPPYRIEMKFYRKDHGVFDYHNLCQAVLDCITGKVYFPRPRNKRMGEIYNRERDKIKWLEDDNMNWIIPVFVPYEVDKDDPRVEIRVL